MLAGGRSTRFGADKLAAIHRGIPLLHHAVLRLGEVCAEVARGHRAGRSGAVDAARRRPSGSSATSGRARDRSLGLVSGLEAASTELAFVAGGDMPDLSTAVLLEMLRVAGEARVDAVALHDADRFRPLPSLVRVAPARDAAGALLDAGERSLRSLLQALRTAVIDEPTWTALDPGRGTLVRRGRARRPRSLNAARERVGRSGR